MYGVPYLIGRETYTKWRRPYLFCTEEVQRAIIEFLWSEGVKPREI